MAGMAQRIYSVEERRGVDASVDLKALGHASPFPEWTLIWKIQAFGWTLHLP